MADFISFKNKKNFTVTKHENFVSFTEQKLYCVLGLNMYGSIYC